MKKLIGILLLGLSLLTTAIVMAIGQISVAIKEAATGNFSFNTGPTEISTLAYIAIIVVILIGCKLISDKK